MKLKENKVNFMINWHTKQRYWNFFKLITTEIFTISTASWQVIITKKMCFIPKFQSEKWRKNIGDFFKLSDSFTHDQGSM